MTRRQLLGLLGAASFLGSREAPVAPVAVARCSSYEEDLAALFSRMFDQLGGLGRLVKGKTVTMKLNLTGSPGLRFQGKPLGVTHYTHPKTVEAVVQLMGKAGARSIRLVESCWGTAGPLEEYLLDSGWNVRSLAAAARNVEFENTNALGKGKRYARLKAPGGARVFAAYDLNAAYEETDVFVSMAKLKEHETCGVTLSMKNCFGNLPASIYGDDAGEDMPNENPTKGRLNVCHYGKRQPSRSAPEEIDPSSSRDAGYRVPWITAEVVAARPINLAVIEGIETITGGEGPWIKGIRLTRPGVLVAGTNPVCTDAVATAVMGYEPGADRGRPPFRNCENTLRLGEALGVGTANLGRIEVRGVAIAEAVHRFER